jgi:hypothetical protein
MKLDWTEFKQLGLEIISRWKYEKMVSQLQQMIGIFAPNLE